MDIFEKSKLTGIFFSLENEQVFGELNLLGKETSLTLRHSKPFSFGDIICGLLYDQENSLKQNITLIDCIQQPMSIKPSRGHENFCMKIFPHYLTIGNCYVAHDEKSITQIRFLINDSSTLFYDFDAFGRLLAPVESIEEIIRLHTKKINREVAIGSDPRLLYFSGKYEIFSTDTILGTLSAWHRPNFSVEGPDGIFIKNKIFISLVFKEPVIFSKSIDSMKIVVQYCEILIGQPQNINEIEIVVEEKDETPEIIDVYRTMWPKQNTFSTKKKTSPSGILVDPIVNPEKFSSVLINWLNRNSTWRDARSRFFTSFREGNKYVIDRLIRSANMFDIIPSSAFPDSVDLSEELKSARDECRTIFTELSPSSEGESVLSALGRIGKMSLKNKVRQRSNIILNVVSSNFPDLFPDLIKVTDEAVNCRNHYVHGSKSKIDYSDKDNSDSILPFLIDTLEFVFAASELVEAGWDIKSWCEKGSRMFHPFNTYRRNYRNNLEQLNFLFFSNRILKKLCQNYTEEEIIEIKTYLSEWWAASYLSIAHNILGYTEEEIIKIKTYLSEWSAASYLSIAHNILDHADRKHIDPLKLLRKAHNFNKKRATRIPPKDDYWQDQSAVYRKNNEYLIVRLDPSGIEKIVTYGVN